MENREPYEIRRVMIVYNAFQTVFSFWMFKESWAFFVSGDYSWHCQPVDYSNNDQVLLSPLHWKQILKILFWPCYFCSGSPCFTSWLVVLFLKICRSSWHSILHNEEEVQPGWYDAWCLVIPSEQTQFSRCLLFMWFITAPCPGSLGGDPDLWEEVTLCLGPSSTQVTIDTKKTKIYFCLYPGVHTVMYFYYLCAAFGPEVQKYLWWKKYITTIQLVQFVLVFFHAIQPLFFECNFPRAASLMFAGLK